MSVFAPLLVLLLVVPIVELAIIVRVARAIDLGPTILLLIAVSIVGAMLLKREGLAAWRRLQLTIAEGRMPTTELADGALILFGGALLLTPGFLTDAIGLLCVLPPTRATMKGAFRRLLAFLAIRRWPAGYAGTRVYRGHVTRSDRRYGPDDAPNDAPGPSPPSLHPPPGEDDSPDRG